MTSGPVCGIFVAINIQTLRVGTWYVDCRLNGILLAILVSWYGTANIIKGQFIDSIVL